MNPAYRRDQGVKKANINFRDFSDLPGCGIIIQDK